MLLSSGCFDFKGGREGGSREIELLWRMPPSACIGARRGGKMNRASSLSLYSHGGRKKNGGFRPRRPSQRIEKGRNVSLFAFLLHPRDRSDHVLLLLGGEGEEKEA